MRTIDLFAGCGGLSLGFQNASFGESKFEILAAYDSWKPAVHNYLLNFKHPVIEFDLSDPNSAYEHISKNFPEVDIIIGGPPCQDFSHAGKRNEGNRASLTKSFALIIQAIKPRWFMMENVDRAQASRAFQEARRIFKNEGYGLTEKVLDASFCSVPQKRKRFFCVGLLGSDDGFLEPLIIKHLAQYPMTIREYMGEELKINHYYRHPRNYNRRAVFSIDEPAPTIRGVNRPVPTGYPGHKGDTGCVKTEEIRPLTTFERARLQTFPKNFVWSGTKTNLEQLIGNAVPVNLGMYMANRILEYQNLHLEVASDNEPTLKKYAGKKLTKVKKVLEHV